MAKQPEQTWPASKVELWPIEKIKPYDRNPRTHPQAQIDLIASSMMEDGVTAPILVDEDGVIIYGHGRRLAAVKNGFAKYPVITARGWSDERKRAVRIRDNATAALSGWDTQLVRTEIGDLKVAGYDVALLGFKEAQLRGWGILGGASNTQDPEAIPPVPKKPVVRVGDIWALGKHRIAVGDATEAGTWDAMLGNERAAMAFTDPPYGVSYAAQSGKFDVIKGDDKRRDDLYKMLVSAFRQLAGHTVPKAAFYIWHASSTREDFAEAMKAVGLSERQYLMWVKPAFVFGRADYQWQHEPAFYAAKGDQAPSFYGERAESTVWHAAIASTKEVAMTIGNGILLLDGQGGTLFIQAKAPKNKKLRQIRVTKDTNVFLSGSERQDGTVWEVTRDLNAEHPTQKPVELARRAIENSSKTGEIVLDGFLGGGCTLIGCEMTGRRCMATELDPVYAEVSIRRWERFAGQQATLDGKTFDEVAKQRRGGNDATGHSGKSVPGKNPRGDRGQQTVRKARNVGRAAARRQPAGEPPPVAGNS